MRLCALGFYNQVLLDLQRALKMLKPMTINQLLGVSHVL